VKIYVTKVIEKYDEGLLPLLDSDRRGRVGEIKNEKEQLRSITAGLLLHYAFVHSGKREDEWDKITIKKGQYGKPYIDGDKNFHYSISHSGDYVLCAVDNKEIGADIQEKRKWKMTMAKRFFDITEYRRISDADESERTDEFYRIWAAKESASKLSGRGIGAGVSHLVTDENYRKIANTKEEESYNIKIYDELEGYVVSACSREKRFPDRLNVVYL
jgi:4'-phosphopantetheinyl transferase